MNSTPNNSGDSDGLFLDLCGRDGVMAIVYRRRDRDVVCASIDLSLPSSWPTAST